MQVFPAKINGDLGTAYWLPSYFTQWYGASLVLPDTRAAALDETVREPQAAGQRAARMLAHVREHYDLEQNAARLMDVYRRLANRAA